MIPCPECGDIFRRRSRLDEHLAWHSSMRSPEPSPFVQAERMLTGRRWSSAEAERLMSLVRIGSSAIAVGDRMNIDVPMSAALAQTTLTVRVTGRHRARARIWVGSNVIRLGAAITGTKVDIDQGPITIGTLHTHESCVTTHEKASATRD